MTLAPDTIHAYGPPPGPPPGGYGGYGGGSPPPGGYGGYGGPPPGGFGGGFGPPPMGPPPGGFGAPPYGGPPMGPMMMPEPSKGLATASLVCGILSLPATCCCSFLSLPLSIAAVVMGGMAISKANNSPQTHGGRGLAVGGLVTGICGLLFAVIALAAGMGQYLVDNYR